MSAEESELWEGMSMEGFCTWTYDDECGMYDTECDHAFEFLSDGIEENGFIFCPYCGMKIREE